jgi:hypothetical protein
MENESMNPIKSDSEKFFEFAKQIVSVPKAEIDRREKEYKKSRAKKGKRL